MPSLAMRAVALLLHTVYRRGSITAADARRNLQQQRPQSRPPRRLTRRHVVTERQINGFTVYSITPRTRPTAGGVHYLHGGAYVAGMTSQHWTLVSRLVDAGLHVDVPEYGLAPQYTHHDAYPFVIQAYQDLRRQITAGPVHVAGDSAGGGLALGLTQTLIAEGIHRPDRLVLIAPWLDTTLKNPDIDTIDDPWLSPPAVREYAKAWAGGTDLDDSRLSPINGPLTGLPPTTVYIGTRDILYPDVHQWGQHAKAAGAPVTLTVCKGAVHVYPITPTPEGRASTTEIVTTLTTDRARDQ